MNEPPENTWVKKFEYKENEKADLVFVDRECWAAPLPRWPGDPDPLITPAANVMCVYTKMNTCFKKEDCLFEMLNLIRKSMNEYKYPDLKYNFVIGNEGRVYIGRGWKTRPEIKLKSLNYDLELNRTLLVGFTGSRKSKPPKVMFAVRDELILHGIENNYISPDYKLFSSVDKRKRQQFP